MIFYSFSLIIPKIVLSSFMSKLDEDSIPEILQYGPYYTYHALNVFSVSRESNLYISYANPAAGPVPCGGPKRFFRADYIFLSVLWD